MSDQILNAVNVELKRSATGKVILAKSPTAHFPHQTETCYYGKDGAVTTDITQAMEFDTNMEAIELAEVFRKVMFAYLMTLHTQLKGNATLQSDDEVAPDIQFILVFTPPIPGHPNEYYNEDFASQGMSTTIFDMATKFATPGEALAKKDAFRSVFKEGYEDRISIRPYVEGDKPSAQPSVRQDAQSETPTEQAATQEPYYVIRFLDKNRENDTAGDITAPCWVRYYCEGEVMRSMEAAETFDSSTEVVKIYNALRAAGTGDGRLEDVNHAVLLKLQLLGIVMQTPSVSGVQLSFNPDIVIQVLTVKDNETGETSWDMFLQDTYQWVFVEPGEEDDEVEEDEESHDEQ